MNSRIRRLAVMAVAFVACAYFAALAYMYVRQRDFLYLPRGTLVSPLEAGLAGVTQEQVAMDDGVKVVVWRADPASPDDPTVLYFHGNSGSLSDRAGRFQDILDSGMGLYAATYRGYPGAGGSPSETALIGDGLAHFDRLSESGAPIVLHGESLGSGVATAVAAERDAAALILEAPYTATVDVAAEQYFWLPVQALMKDQFKSRDRIANVREPVLIVHGTADTVIPISHGRALYQLANEPKSLQEMEGADHGEIWPGGLWPAALEFLGSQGVLVASPDNT